MRSIPTPSHHRQRLGDRFPLSPHPDRNPDLPEGVLKRIVRNNDLQRRTTRNLLHLVRRINHLGRLIHQAHRDIAQHLVAKAKS